MMHEITIDRIERAGLLLREMKRNYKKLVKMGAVDLMDLSPKQAQKQRVDADWIGMDNIKIRHQLHALAVELDFADRRESYDPIELTDGWGRFKYQPPEPNP